MSASNCCVSGKSMRTPPGTTCPYPLASWRSFSRTRSPWRTYAQLRMVACRSASAAARASAIAYAVAGNPSRALSESVEMTVIRHGVTASSRSPGAGGASNVPESAVARTIRRPVLSWWARLPAPSPMAALITRKPSSTVSNAASDDGAGPQAAPRSSSIDTDRPAICAPSSPLSSASPPRVRRPESRRGHPPLGRQLSSIARRGIVSLTAVAEAFPLPLRLHAMAANRRRCMLSPPPLKRK
jgi:hypothetical protein